MKTPETIRELITQGYTILSPDKTAMLEPGGGNPPKGMFIKKEESGEFVIRKTLPVTDDGIRVAMEILNVH